MSTPSLEKSHAYHDLMQYVKAFGVGCGLGIQLQKVRCMRHRETGDWLLEIDFYPEPRRLIWVAGEARADWGFMSQAALGDQVFVSAQNPLALYLKSHFVGRRLKALVAAGEGRTTLWDFGEGYAWRIALKAPALLEWTLEVPAKRPFVKELRLYPASFFASAVEPPASVAAEPALRSKDTRLLENVRSDLHSARTWLESYTALCRELEGNPRRWDAGAATDKASRGWDEKIAELQASGLLPKSREAAFLKNALGKLFRERSRQERKVQKAAARLAEIEGKIASGEMRARRDRENTRYTENADPKKSHPGLRIEILPGIYGYLGRSARENDELFRHMRDRDFWFHVRGYSGTHLWLRRADLGLGKDGVLPPQLAQRAAKIALFNSKLKNSGSGPVDITEKRHLKKIKGEIAALKIAKSEVLFVSLEEGFEKTLKWS